MIGTDTISRVIGQDVYDESGEKIGSAAEVYLDDETGQPEWVTVRTGLFGTKESFVPIRNADLTDDGVRVPVSKTQVKDAPKIDTDGHLSPEEEQELYRYYGLGSGQELLLPVVDQGRVDAELGGYLVDCLVTLESGQCDLGLERRRVTLSLTRHWFPFPGLPV